jgi:tetrahydromethanopterin S-methyltransferase subunit G
MHAHPIEARIAHVEGAFDQVNERLGSVDRRLDSIDSRFNAIDARFNWVIGVIVGAWVTMIATQVTTILTIVNHR